MSRDVNIDDYQIIYQNNPEDFAKEIVLKISQGWLLHGLAFSWGEYLCQAMVRLIFPEDGVKKESEDIPIG